MPTRPRRDLRVCARCRRIVEAFADVWVHVYEPEDGHEPEPIEYAGIATDVPCDFCSSSILDGEAMVVPLKPFEMPMNGSRHRSESNWVACRLCSSLIEGAHWDILVRRSVLRYEEEARLLGEPPLDRNELLAELNTTYALVRVHMTGPVRPWEAGDEQEVS